MFEDPLALAILGRDEERQLRLSDPAEGRRAAPGRAFVVARHRFAEDRLAEAVARGVSQIVILGAGLDTFAYRSPFRTLRVFEIDRPAMQRWKRGRLQEAGITVPTALAFVPVDLEHESLTAALCPAGFDVRRPAFVTWLGTTIYLPTQAVLATLKDLAGSMASGTEIVFDYAVPPASLDPTRRATWLRMAEEAASFGEPYRSEFERAGLTAHLRALRYSRVEDEGPKELNERYFVDRDDGVLLRGPGHVVHART